MKNKAKAFFAVTSWDEKTWDGLPAGPVEGEKLTHARVSDRKSTRLNSSH